MQHKALRHLNITATPLSYNLHQSYRTSLYVHGVYAHIFERHLDRVTVRESKTGMQVYNERETIHLVIHSLNVHSSHGWTNTQTGTPLDL